MAGWRAAVDDLAISFGVANRSRKWELYGQEFPPHPNERVLDVGVSRMTTLSGENYFLNRYPYPHQLTGIGISDLAGLSFHYPGVTFIQADGRHLPFADGSFDVVHSNAVVEHVGAYQDQTRFVAEL